MSPEDIRYLRTECYGLTREEFANALGVTAQTIYFWEKGTYFPSRYDLVVLYRLWEMYQNPFYREKAKQALKQAATLPPVPPNNINYQNTQNKNSLGPLIAGGLIGIGLGLLLSKLFGEDTDEPSP